MSEAIGNPLEAGAPGKGIGSDRELKENSVFLRVLKAEGRRFNPGRRLFVRRSYPALGSMDEKPTQEAFV